MYKVKHFEYIIESLGRLFVLIDVNYLQDGGTSSLLIPDTANKSLVTD